MMLQKRNGHEIAVPASDIKIMHFYAIQLLLKPQILNHGFGKKIEKFCIKLLVKKPLFLENILAGALNIYVEMHWETLELRFGYDIILIKSFGKGAIFSTSGK